MVFQLDNNLWFPDPHLGEADGLVAVGGDLSVDRLLLAYSYGYFPWFSFKREHEPLWFCPLQRFVIFPKEIHVSHSMRQLIDCQFETPHLRTMGGRFIPYEEYLRIIRKE